MKVLARYARHGGALELGVGTGRIAIPLARAGASVHGIDNSPHMLRRLRAKTGGELVHDTLADMADYSLGRRFALVYSVFNSIFRVADQQRQLACFAATARHLAGPDGRFLVELRALRRRSAVDRPDGPGPMTSVRARPRRGAQLVLRAVSSMTNEVWRLESSAPPNVRVTVCPA
ncbi:class I SAM-dependent methyltransferase [Streptomyces sp. G-G2]|uniref:class I SAM-dependent methyltransferase n=1 Tax=Streptomyces sp. G-G2 TaxID=3046201 RepID=UPI0024BBD77A|nr:class I SAM-dependent methyltransferase [Streptomyces sp. G-G2]MDJ0382063.1 class I SAM-dependent methyltransferase [Streptomyces sp. G-G2]